MKDKKGFTLAELLVVVAIIAVLVAVSIPIFSTKLHDARVARDWANIRNFYAELKMEENETGDLSFLSKYPQFYLGRDSLPNKTKLVSGVNMWSNTVKNKYRLQYRCDEDCEKHKVDIYYSSTDPSVNTYKWGS